MCCCLKAHHVTPTPHTTPAAPTSLTSCSWRNGTPSAPRMLPPTVRPQVAPGPATVLQAPRRSCG
eukprot:scaffold33644_cov63-Phaeocystis_antarctica.AAC.7